MSNTDTTRLDHGLPDDGPDPGPLDGDAVARLLALGRDVDRRPVAGLIDRLQRTDGASWFASAVIDRVIVPWGSPERLLGDPPASVSQLRALKDAGHELIESSDVYDDRLAGVAAYFIAVAAALAGHGERITRRGRDRLDPMLLDLADVLPGAWGDLLARAATTGEC